MEEQKKLLQDKPRIAGVIAFLIGTGASAWYYDHTMTQANAHTSQTIYLPHGFAALVSFAVLGIALMVFGQKMADYSKGLRGRKKTLKDWLFIACFTLPGIAAFFFLENQLKQLGYE
jgi:hypothetical protein